MLRLLIQRVSAIAGDPADDPAPPSQPEYRGRLTWAGLDDDVVVYDSGTLLTHRLAGALAARWRELIGDRYQPALEGDALDALDELGLADLPGVPTPQGETWASIRRGGYRPFGNSVDHLDATTVSVAGRRIVLQCGVAELESRVRARFGSDRDDPNHSSSDLDLDVDSGDAIAVVEEAGSIVVAVGGLVVQEFDDVDAAAGFLWWALNLCATSVLGDDTLVHASAAARGDRAVALTGESGAGKSTLLAALVLQGLDPVSDEVTRLAGGRVLPWRSPIDLDPRSQQLLGLARPLSDADTAGSQSGGIAGSRSAGGAAVDATVLAVVSHQGSTDPVEITPIDRFSALNVVLAAGFHPDGRRCEDFDRLVALVKRATCVACAGSDPVAKAEALADLVGG